MDKDAIREFSAEREGIAWIATPPDDTISDYGKYFYVDPRTGVLLKENFYPRGMITGWHKHTHAHGMVVLEGTLHTDEGDYPPGTFLWWPAGSVAEHGATQDDDVRVYFMTAGAFDLLFQGGPCPEANAAGLAAKVVDPAAVEWQERADNEGNVYDEKPLLNDEITGMVVSLRRYPAMYETDWHTFDGSYGFYVTKGILKSDRGFFGPGSFVWYPKGSVSRLGASRYTDAEVIYVADTSAEYTSAPDPSNWTRG